VSLKITLFSPEEATALAHKLRPELERLGKLKQELDRLETRVGVLQLTLSAGGSDESPEARELASMRADRARITARIAAGADAILRHGVLLKDVDQGLVDFYALSGDRLVFLCWKRDEPEVSHWHPLESGFSGRQKLDTSELE
jgi:hypothetical protein